MAMQKRILIAGGLCGTTMLMASKKITERCAQKGVFVDATIQNLWETTYVARNYDLIVEMFPFFKDQKCPVISGKPFISHAGEKALVEHIAQLLCDGDQEEAK